jgi:hypothetical protein
LLEIGLYGSLPAPIDHDGPLTDVDIKFPKRSVRRTGDPVRMLFRRTEDDSDETMRGYNLPCVHMSNELQLICFDIFLAQF